MENFSQTVEQLHFNSVTASDVNKLLKNINIDKGRGT